MLTDIVNHLWQSTLIATAIAALAVMLRDHGAHVRYWLWWAASVKFLVPFSLLTMLGERARHDDCIVLRLHRPAGSSRRYRRADAGGGARGRRSLWHCSASGRSDSARSLGVWVDRALKVRALLRASVAHSAVLPRGAGGPQVRTSKDLVEPALVGLVRPVLLLPQKYCRASNAGAARRRARARARALAPPRQPDRRRPHAGGSRCSGFTRWSGGWVRGSSKSASGRVTKPSCVRATTAARTPKEYSTSASTTSHRRSSARRESAAPI